MSSAAGASRSWWRTARFARLHSLRQRRRFLGRRREWLARIGVKTLYIELGSPCENGYNESFNRKLRDELLNGEIFYSLAEARYLIERWQRHYNQVRPHSSLDYTPPAPEAVLPVYPSNSL
jgi:transposase InsO family protein